MKFFGKINMSAVFYHLCMYSVNKVHFYNNYIPLSNFFCDNKIFISLICSHFVDRITVRTSFGLFILGYFITMDYGHIASDKGASICERSVLSFDIRVLIFPRKKPFHLAI